MNKVVKYISYFLLGMILAYWLSCIHWTVPVFVVVVMAIAWSETQERKDDRAEEVEDE